ncbi:hypothetical protein PV396_43020 [Streptomyces sp. ME02-8801-2C]|uniref:hypothetical protein n=1 Tax=Streptomyces sp. ME02-8801-2C TaxID=3028680 RepID=UPI0029BEB6C2|nr:hypothetical protein [Streptomyces sp. ME02-8801-2C]MDX3458624.1 hypothetical protein [Streptomyces sp. ME02-8801-2C]
MPRIPAPIRAFTRPRRAFAAAALAALVLTGCGGAESSDSGSGSGSQAGPDRVAGAEGSATPSTPEQAAFAAMLDKLAQPCSSTNEAATGPTSGKPAGSTGKESLAPGEVPPAEPVEPGAPQEPGAELSDRDQCASVQHEQRVVEALQAVQEPTPAKVREVLNGLGYIDERIHDLQQDGKATRFYLDLRDKGGRLCEAGLAAGVETDVTPCAAPAAGAFTKADAQPM